MEDLSSSELPLSPPLVWGKRTYIMGVINLTPDSFSGDGMLVGPSEQPERLAELVLEKAYQFVKDGADILDVGGESTRPGAQSVSMEEELSRVVPVI
jgi:dihydropteroate synthase